MASVCLVGGDHEPEPALFVSLLLHTSVRRREVEEERIRGGGGLRNYIKGEVERRVSDRGR